MTLVQGGPVVPSKVRLDRDINPIPSNTSPSLRTSMAGMEGAGVGGNMGGGGLA